MGRTHALMAGRPRVGVTGNARRWAPSRWCSWLAPRLAGATPRRISVLHEADGERFDAMIIGGGNDISAVHYGGKIDARVKPDPARDALEIDEIVRAVEGTPECRILGLQWHPEYLVYLPSQFRLFRWLLSRVDS